MRGDVSLYADYLLERTHDHILEVDEGFATYRFLPENTVYVVDIYVRPECRQYGHAADLANTIGDIARKKGCTTMIGTVQPSAKGAHTSLKVLLAYGMELKSAEHDAIILRKDL